MIFHSTFGGTPFRRTEPVARSRRLLLRRARGVEDVGSRTRNGCATLSRVGGSWLRRNEGTSRITGHLFLPEETILAGRLARRIYSR